MALKDLLHLPTFQKTSTVAIEDITKERIQKDLPQLRKLISYWRVYPDKFVDFLCSLNPDNTFKFFFYQRVFLRAILRHKYVYCVFCRAYSKSFLTAMGSMIKCILYPGSRIFVASAGKEQSASILSSKVQEICRLIPAFEREIIWDVRGSQGKARTRNTKDSVIYTFRNGSSLENVAMTESTRGQRFTSGVLEECASMDQDKLNEIILPTLNVSRNVPGYGVDENEIANQSAVYITTAGYKGTFSYDKLIQTLCQSVARPDQAIILGGTYRTPMMERLLSRNFISDLKQDGTFNEASFDREYNSIWSGSIEGAFFDTEKFDKYRDIQLPEWEANNKSSKNAYYLLGVDVGRVGCTTEVIVMKVTPAPTGVSQKHVVNLFTYDAEHFGEQSIHIKRLYHKYKCRIAVIDANGLGAGLVDWLVIDQDDPDTGEPLGALGVYNDDEGTYKKFLNNAAYPFPNSLYLMKANATINTELYSYCQTQMGSGKIRFLIDENTAKNKLMAQAQSKKMSRSRRAAYLQPYVLTSILEDQMANLVQENEGMNIILKQNNRTIKKDKVSALIYALSWPKMIEEKGGRKRRGDLSKLMLFSSARR